MPYTPPLAAPSATCLALIAAACADGAQPAGPGPLEHPAAGVVASVEGVVLLHDEARGEWRRLVVDARRFTDGRTGGGYESYNLGVTGSALPEHAGSTRCLTVRNGRAWLAGDIGRSFVADARGGFLLLAFEDHGDDPAVPDAASPGVVVMEARWADRWCERTPDDRRLLASRAGRVRVRPAPEDDA